MQTLDIVKIGGSIANSPGQLSDFLDGFTSLGYPKLLVHGGGSAASDLCRKLDIPIQMIDGRRITDEPALDVAVMVYAGLINKTIVARLQSFGCNAIGLSGADLNIIPAQKRDHPTIDYGFVGDISAETVNAYVLSRLLEEQAVPVFSAVTHDQNGQLLNTNADTIASVLAAAMSSEYSCRLTYCFEKNGVLEDRKDDRSWIEEINRQKYADLKERKIISEGMIPKLDSAFKALENGVTSVHIKNASGLNSNTGTKLIL